MDKKFDIKELVKLGDEKEAVLHQVCEDIEEGKIDESLVYLKDMYNFVGTSGYAIGLSLPQMGIAKRGFVVNGRTLSGKKIGDIFINPIIIGTGISTEKMVERCLSEPGVNKLLERPKDIRVKYINREGVEKTRLFDGLYARVIQHEMDHLNGILISDKV